MENKDIKVMGPLSLWQFLLIFSDTVLIYMTYLYVGYGTTFWIVSAVVVSLSLAFWYLKERK